MYYGLVRKDLSKLNENDNVFTPTLESVTVEDWCRTWVVDRTIMMRRTSKRVKVVVDKMYRPVDCSCPLES